MSFIDTVREHKCSLLQTVVDSASGKFLCYARLDDDQFYLGASDGDNVWTFEMTEQSFDSYKEISGLNTESLLLKIRNAFKDNNMMLSQDSGKVSLTLGKATNCIEINLFDDATQREKRKEMRTILFKLADLTCTLQAKLDSAESKIESLKLEKGTGPQSALDVANVKSKETTKTVTKQAGMSVINPGSRKRKAARGVEFD